MSIVIPFNKPYLAGNEITYIKEANRLGKISGNGYYTRKCQRFFESKYGFGKCLLTSSCTDALEMAAILLNIGQGDEVILPSYTFVSTANAFVLRGASIVFVDSKKDHPGMDVDLIEEQITSKTRVIVVVHYAGFPVEMEKVMDIADRHNIQVVEDAAQAIHQKYKDKYLGSWGHLATFSFHETKNIQCGEGGMLVINEPALEKRAEIVWEKGTDRAAFFRGEINKYGWVDLGSSFLLSELNAAYLWAQLENLDDIQNRRQAIWKDYYRAFNEEEYQPQVLSTEYLEIVKNLKFKDKSDVVGQDMDNRLGVLGFSEFRVQTSRLQANSHMFYLVFSNLDSRAQHAQALKEKGILAVFHYQSLHKSEFIKNKFPVQYRRVLPNSDRYSDCLLRLPLFYELPELSKQEFG